MPEKHDCIVIGAGPAGLLAAVTLKETGKDVIVLEARDRIGGRAYSAPLSDGTHAEHGAHVLHGPTIATWEFVARFGMATHHVRGFLDHGGDTGFRDGEWVQESDPMAQEAYEILDEIYEAVLSGPVSEDVTVSEALVAAGLTGSRLKAVEAAAQDMAQLHTSEMSARAAAEMRRMVKPTTPVFSLVDGYTGLWQKLSQPIKDLIHLDSPVSALEWSPEGVLAHVPGGELEASTAIMTLPVGVLRDGTVKFNPVLP